ncbi:GTPase HflX [soil metagenome]
MVQRALLVGVYFDRSDADEAASLLEELEELVGTLGIATEAARLVRVAKQTPRYLIGSGKAAALIAEAHDLECDVIIFDNELSPAQQRGWEKDADLAVIDRQEFILDIFAIRAQTKYARLQVELARMQYSLPRLTRMWAHLDRQGGGTGGGKGGGGAARGEGEKQVEVDRRIARERIDRAKRELAEIRKQRGTRRQAREKLPVPHGAIVGYTNAGKSSLLNKITRAEVLAEDKLFATLDTTTRRLDLPDGQPLLLTDTVGFIRRLPHRLVESFKATLEESLLSDFLIHVVDASSPDVYDHYQTTRDVLEELGAGDKQSLIVLNKIDKLGGDPIALHQLHTHFPDAIFASVLTGENLDVLVARMNDLLMDRVVRMELRLPPTRGDLVSLAHGKGKIVSQEYADDGDIVLTAIVPVRLVPTFAEFAVQPAQAPVPTA